MDSSLPSPVRLAKWPTISAVNPAIITPPVVPIMADNVFLLIPDIVNMSFYLALGLAMGVHFDAEFLSGELSLISHILGARFFQAIW